MIENNKLETAQDYFNRAYKLHVDGKVDQAIDFYKISIDVFPTAEAHTFLGWAFSMKGNYQDAIDECYLAIDIDPDYGNPYNDIGTYLVSLMKYDEAIMWFEKAINAPNYSLRHYPYFNLGSVYEKKGAWFEALNYYKDALKINPDYELAQKALVRITTLLN